MNKRNMVIAGVVVALVAAGALWLVLRPGAGLSRAGRTPSGTETSATATATSSVEASASAEASADVAATIYASIPIDGVHEKAAMAAVPAALKTAAEKKKQLSAEMPDLSSATPALTSYGIIARIDKRNYLFQVFADGKAYEYLRYPAKPDPATQYALDVAGFVGEPLADPAGAREKAAAAAVQSLMDKAFPSTKAKVQIWNYGFTFIGKSGKPVTLSNGTVFQITISPKGKLTTME